MKMYLLKQSNFCEQTVHNRIFVPSKYSDEEYFIEFVPIVFYVCIASSFLVMFRNIRLSSDILYHPLDKNAIVLYNNY